MSKTKKVIVVSNAFLITSGIESLVLELSGMLIDTIFDGSEKKLCHKIINKKPDYIFIDPDSVSEQLIPLLRELSEETEIVIIGIVSKTTLPNITSRFSHTIRKENNKHQLIDELHNIIGNNNESVEDSELLITKRETEILRNLALGLTNQEVADKLFLSVHTVMTHRKKITRKLGIKSVSGLTVFALLNNIVDIREVERSI